MIVKCSSVFTGFHGTFFCKKQNFWCPAHSSATSLIDKRHRISALQYNWRKSSMLQEECFGFFKTVAEYASDTQNERSVVFF